MGLDFILFRGDHGKGNLEAADMKAPKDAFIPLEPFSFAILELAILKKRPFRK
jgi:hypothetical protein